MQTQQTFSTNKIIFLITFLFAALMTSVFVFHMSNEQTAPMISADYGTIYPAARDIKSFELLAANNEKFTQKNLLGHWTLMFFGFTHCTSVCPTTLTVLDKVYRQLKKSYPNLQVVLISLDPERDTLDALNNYIHSFNSAFIGATGKYPEIRKLQSQFGIFSGHDPNSGENYQLNHTASINLINPSAKWAGLFHYGLSPTQLSQAVSESLRKLS